MGVFDSIYFNNSEGKRVEIQTYAFLSPCCNVYEIGDKVELSNGIYIDRRYNDDNHTVVVYQSFVVFDGKVVAAFDETAPMFYDADYGDRLDVISIHQLGGYKNEGKILLHYPGRDVPIVWELDWIPAVGDVVTDGDYRYEVEVCSFNTKGQSISLHLKAINLFS